ncbi:MAG: hypothetical protein AAF847_10155 [Bacteroidota bacterium]
MNKAIAISFTCLLLLQSFDQLRLMVYYHLFQDYITANYCVNVAAPQLMCSGRCYLDTQFEAAQEKQQQIPSSIVADQLLDYFLIPEQPVYAFDITEAEKTKFAELSFYPFLLIYSLLRPPR